MSAAEEPVAGAAPVPGPGEADPGAAAAEPAWDDAQRVARALDPRRHAVVLGAPGTGKTAVLLDTAARLLNAGDFVVGELLVLASNRTVSARLRGRIEAAVTVPLHGATVRTGSSLAFAVLAAERAARGEPRPRLLTGAVQDELLAEIVEAALADGSLAAPPEVARAQAFRNELREVWRVCVDAELGEAELARLAAEQGWPAWGDAAALLASFRARLAAEHPDEFDASSMHRAAVRALRDAEAAGERPAFAPRLILVDDAQDLTQAGAGLLRQLARGGAAIWAFGDPDIGTGAFQGLPTGLLGGVAGALDLPAVPGAPAEQRVVLETVHRHGAELRARVAQLTGRIGAAGGGGQRRAQAAAGLPGGSLSLAICASPSEQLGVVAHRLRERHLGLGRSRPGDPIGAPAGGAAAEPAAAAAPVPWSEMAVICRSQGEANRVARALVSHQVPTGQGSGGLVLREHRIVRELIWLVQAALGLRAVDAPLIEALLSGVVGGLDRIALKRLRAALTLQEGRDGGERGLEEILLEAAAFPELGPAIDSRGGRALRRVGRVLQAATGAVAAGGSPREALWAAWAATGLADRWERDAIEGEGTVADDANRVLDAVVGLFFAVQRFEEQASELPVAEFLDGLLVSALPEDSLARRAEREAITVTTPQGMIGREARVVVILGLQEGGWPNLKPRGSIFGHRALEGLLRAGVAEAPGRRETLHDELRLLAQAVSRAREEVLVVAVASDDAHPSALTDQWRDAERTGLPSTRLTLRGAVAELRRRVTEQPGDEAAHRALAELVVAGVPGADPEQWYGVAEPSTAAPLVDLDDPEARVRVSPSQLERAETCALDWAIASLGGGDGNTAAAVGTLVHHAFETVAEADPERLFRVVDEAWGLLDFDAEWESERMRGVARRMVGGLADYLDEVEGSGRVALGSELGFAIPLGRAVLGGLIDRLEAVPTSAGGTELSILDLKTGKTAPTAAAVQGHAQLAAYQLAIILRAIRPRTDDPEAPVALPEGGNGGARLLYVHPAAVGSGRSFREFGQQPLGEEEQAAFVERVERIAEVMAAGSFVARVEHHCTSRFAFGQCRIHVIGAVSAG